MLRYTRNQTEEMQKHWKMVQWWQAELDPSLLCFHTGYRFYLYCRSMCSHYQNCAHVITRVVTSISRIMTPESWHKPPLEITLSMQNSSALKIAVFFPLKALDSREEKDPGSVLWVVYSLVTLSHELPSLAHIQESTKYTFNFQHVCRVINCKHMLMCFPHCCFWFCYLI